ncbi:RagB/SusD family nutrient uptake outer membrane protein [Pedobacter nyackensis]|uniref:RagB/SusD family nutrient uptake outer membrane protein n=1 Tax=Pedobacter nyackensis TaxID=475255 RepID=UPI002931DCDF|nr:RagB/SusD family nutrient uptake outer membrane protein [Pedobacter nyackensis]
MKKKIMYVAGLCLLAVTTSCEKYLDRIPPHSLVEDNAIVDGASAEAALIGAFVPLKNMNPSPFGANYISNGSQMVGFTTGRFRAFDEQLELNAFNTGDGWNECSEIINATNAVIQKTAEISDGKFVGNRKNEIIAEARFMRFFAQYYIFRYYGQFWDLNSKYGALMRREPAKVSTNNYARSTVEETYRLLFEDLDHVIEKGPDFTTVYRPSKLLAKAYKAEVHLMRGTNADLEKAITLANEVLNDPKRKKEAAYADIFSKGYSSTELLFTRFMDQQMLSGVFSNVGSIVRMFGGTFAPTPLFENILAGDNRASFYKRIDVVNGANVVRVPKLYKADGNCLPYYMRTSEMDLIKAEAYARLNQKSNAVDAVNVLRLRAGGGILNASEIADAELQTVVFNEAAREMGLENGYEWFAAIRLKGTDGRNLIFTLKPAVKEIKQFIWPIPQKEKELNKLMIQNPGYEGI